MKDIKKFLTSKILRYSILAIFFGCIAGGAIAIYELYRIAGTLPDAEEITRYRMNQPSMVYDSSGNVIAELGNERRYPIPISEMPLHIRQAIVAVEDARFYEHNGIDLLGIIRATFKNIRSGRLAEGGSTLTQQLVKNIYLSPERKFMRKFKEAVIAYRIDNYLTKDEILEFYLNQVNFGRGGYGVQAAAINYFGKNAKDMTLAECALLAGIPKAPGVYAPHINHDRALQRRNYVLLRMFENGYITEEEYNQAIEEPIVITSTTPLRLRHAGYFLDYTLRYLNDELGISEPQSKGLKVYTTLNIEFQEKAEESVRKNLLKTSHYVGYFGPAGNATKAFTEPEPRALQSDGEDIVGMPPTLSEMMQTPTYLSAIGFEKAIVNKVNDTSLEISLGIGDNVSKGVVNLVNNRWARPYISKTSQLNDFKTILKENDIIYVIKHPKDEGVYMLEQDPVAEAALLAIDPKSGAIYAMVGGFSFEKSMFNRATQAKRQVGSVFKPLVYATAFENGYQPMTKILDAPILAQPDEDGAVWRPKNYDDRYFGEITLKEGLTRSLNTVTVKIAEKVGLRKILRYVKDFGIYSALAHDMSITIGSGSISLIEMVYAYSVFPNMGTRPIVPYFITKVEDAEGKILFEIDAPEHVNVLKPNTAQIMNDMLMNVVENGTGFRAKAIPRPIGAKTGTSNQTRDAWFIGYLPNLVVGVWTGFDDFGINAEVGTGSWASGPQWVDFVSSIIDKIPFAVFPVTNGVIYRKVDTTKWEPTTELMYENTSFEPYSYELNIDEQDNATGPLPAAGGNLSTGTVN